MNEVQVIQCPICGEALEVGKTSMGSYEAERKKLVDRAHKSLDSIWKCGIAERIAVYKWLSVELGLKTEDCHLSKLTVNQLRQTITLCNIAKKRMQAILFKTKAPEQFKRPVLNTKLGLRKGVHVPYGR